MKDDRLQLRVAPLLKKQATEVAQRRQTTLSALVTHFLQRLVDADLVEQRAAAAHGDDVEQV
jgi:hypothetical protein